MANLKERGQMILLMGFVLAVSFVALALILNTAIYTENLASRSETAGGTEALAHRAMVEASVGELIRFANEENRTEVSGGLTDAKEYHKMESNVSQGVAELNESIQRHTTASIAFVNVSVPQPGSDTLPGVSNDFERGKEIEQTSSGGLTDSSGTINWTVVDNAKLEDGINGTRKFRMELDTSTVPSRTGTRIFEVNVTEGPGESASNFWQMDVSENGASEIVVRVKTDEMSPSETETCTRDVAALSSTVWVNVTDGTFAGRPCPALDFAEDLNEPGLTDYDVTFNNSNQVEGTYSLIANTDDVGSNAGPAPTVKNAVYSTTVEYTYVAPELRYRTEILVEPGEPE